MKISRYALAPLSLLFVFTLLANQCFALISIGILTKEKAKEKYGITMHARKNGDAGIKVWLEFKKEGWLEKFTYAELRMVEPRGDTGFQLSSSRIPFIIANLKRSRRSPFPLKPTSLSNAVSSSFATTAMREMWATF